MDNERSYYRRASDKHKQQREEITALAKELSIEFPDASWAECLAAANDCVRGLCE